MIKPTPKREKVPEETRKADKEISDLLNEFEEHVYKDNFVRAVEIYRKLKKYNPQKLSGTCRRDLERTLGDYQELIFEFRTAI